MDHIHTLIRVMERLHEKSPEFFWIVVSGVGVVMISLLFWAIVAEAMAKLRRQQIEGQKASCRLFLWMRAGGLIALYVALTPVILVIAVVVFLWEDYKLHVKSF
jgi:hypothetical protein